MKHFSTVFRKNRFKTNILNIIHELIKTFYSKAYDRNLKSLRIEEIKIKFVSSIMRE